MSIIRWWNYLRVRGEYMWPYTVEYSFPELPPRARRILVRKTQKGNHHGTTSACAENTLRAFSMTARNWNYLRVRGEYSGGKAAPGDTIGTTSACAENT